MATKFNVAKRDGVLWRTTDATPVVAVNFATRPSKLYWVELKVLAGYSDQSKGAAYFLTAAFRTDSAGTLTQIGSTQSIMTAIEDTAGMDCTVAASSTNIAVTVTGVAATNIQWLLSSDIKENDYVNLT